MGKSTCAKDVSVGTFHQSNSFGFFEVIEYRSWDSITIKFIDTGYITIVESGNIRKGCVKDNLSPIKYGLGFIGDGIYKSREGGVVTNAYHAWSHMLTRCYCYKYHKTRPNYKKCTTCEDWHDFQAFAKWYIENYPDDGLKYDLDKDIKVKGNKVYSPDTCLFVSSSDNTVAARAKSYTVISPIGEEFNIYNLSKFCRDNNLHSGNMSLMLNGMYESSKGWTKP